MKIYILYRQDCDEWIPRGAFSSLEKAQQQAFDDLSPESKKRGGWGWKLNQGGHWDFGLSGCDFSSHISEFVVDVPVVYRSW